MRGNEACAAISVAGLDGGHVHIDVLPAMTGVTRWGELPPPWLYSKVRFAFTGRVQHFVKPRLRFTIEAKQSSTEPSSTFLPLMFLHLAGGGHTDRRAAGEELYASPVCFAGSAWVRCSAISS